jgi:hypothetical protein
MSDEVVLISHGHYFVEADPIYELYVDEFVDVPGDARGCKWYKCTRCGFVTYLPNPELLRLNYCDDMILHQVMNS